MDVTTIGTKSVTLLISLYFLNLLWHNDTHESGFYALFEHEKLTSDNV